MDAAVLNELGTPTFGTYDEPAPGQGQVVVDVALAGLNPVDLTMAAGRFPGFTPDFPSVPGREGIGHVDGRRVYFTATRPFGSMAQRALAEEASLFEVPDGLDEGTAVALGIAGLAAWLPLAWRAKLQEGETVLVMGATGVLGSIAVQAAKLLGAGRVVAAGRNAEGLERAARLGADATVDLTATDDPTTAYAEAAGGEGPDVILDPVWGEPGAAAMRSLAPFGRHVQIGNSADPDLTVHAPPFRNNMSQVMGYTNFRVPRADQAEAYAAMCKHAAAGQIVVETERIPLSEVANAWERQAAFAHRKLLLEP
jgi:NADPH2:quinone reductase